MRQLKQVDNTELLQELQQRLQDNQLSEKELVQMLKAEEWKRAYRLADADPERQKEIAEWDRIQSEDENE